MKRGSDKVVDSAIKRKHPTIAAQLESGSSKVGGQMKKMERATKSAHKKPDVSTSAAGVAQEKTSSVSTEPWKLIGTGLHKGRYHFHIALISYTST